MKHPQQQVPYHPDVECDAVILAITTLSGLSVLTALSSNQIHFRKVEDISCQLVFPTTISVQLKLSSLPGKICRVCFNKIHLRSSYFGPPWFLADFFSHHLHLS